MAAAHYRIRRRRRALSPFAARHKQTLSAVVVVIAHSIASACTMRLHVGALYTYIQIRYMHISCDISITFYRNSLNGGNRNSESPNGKKSPQSDESDFEDESMFDEPDSPESPVSMLCAPKDLSKKSSVLLGVVGGGDDLKPALDVSPPQLVPPQPHPPPPKRSKLCIDEILNLKTSPTAVVPAIALSTTITTLPSDQEQPENLSLSKSATKAEL